jgi:hypothetical protein
MLVFNFLSNALHRLWTSSNFGGKKVWLDMAKKLRQVCLEETPNDTNGSTIELSFPAEENH